MFTQPTFEHKPKNPETKKDDEMVTKTFGKTSTKIFQSKSNKRTDIGDKKDEKDKKKNGNGKKKGMQDSMKDMLKKMAKDGEWISY